MNKNRASYIMDILSIVFFTALTVVAVLMKEITIFYVIYIFWWDELIKTSFDFLRYTFKTNQIEDPENLKVDIGVRFFMLFLYFVFIVICFGFIINWSSQDTISTNIEVLVFQNIYFNISLISFISREAYFYYKNLFTQVGLRNLMSGGILTLHISIILGLLMWGISTKKIVSLPLDLESYSTILAIAPFFIVKILFQWKEIKRNRKEEQINS